MNDLHRMICRSIENRLINHYDQNYVFTVLVLINYYKVYDSRF